MRAKRPRWFRISRLSPPEGRFSSRDYDNDVLVYSSSVSSSALTTRSPHHEISPYASRCDKMCADEHG